MQGGGQRAREFSVRDGVRRHGVERAAQILFLEQMNEETANIIDVHPGHPLSARAERPAETEPEERSNLIHRASTSRDDKSNAQECDANAIPLRSFSSLLPFPGDICQKTAAAGGGFGTQIVAAVAIKSTRGTADQRPYFGAWDRVN